MKAAEDIVKNFKGNATAWRKTERGKSENKNNKDFYKATVYFSSGCMCLAQSMGLNFKDSDSDFESESRLESDSSLWTEKTRTRSPSLFFFKDLDSKTSLFVKNRTKFKNV